MFDLENKVSLFVYGRHCLDADEALTIPNDFYRIVKDFKMHSHKHHWHLNDRRMYDIEGIIG